MLTLTDCVHFSELTAAEIDAIAEHEHIDDVIACELGQFLVHSPHGCRLILKYMVDDIEQAELHHDFARSQHLHRVINQFAAQHHFI